MGDGWIVLDQLWVGMDIEWSLVKDLFGGGWFVLFWFVDMTKEWTKSFTICSITVWNALRRWYMVLMSVVVLRCSCSLISWLYEVSISLRSLLFFSSICLKNSSLLKNDWIVESSFDRDDVVSVALETRSLVVVSVVFVFLLLSVAKTLSSSTS